MKIAIVYATKHGCTEKCANELVDKLPNKPQVFNLNTSPSINLSEYDTVIIGGSIHIGTINRKLKKFINANINELLSKRIALYICCLFSGQKAEEQFQNAYPDELKKIALATGYFGGELIFEKMNFIERAMAKKVANIESNTSLINTKAINDFAQNIIRN
ncbi:MAG: flavodoxin domain-containing protein [Bacteroidales bacterium]|nr:flavodoxin domain-containing protein [Bacteroidales bacterium]